MSQCRLINHHFKKTNSIIQIDEQKVRVKPALTPSSAY